MFSTIRYIQPEVWSAIGSCVAGVAAIAGLIGLWFYVKYTKKIMEATLASWRGQIEPVLVVEFDKSRDGRCHFIVRNAGNGPALGTSVWNMGSEERHRCGTFVDMDLWPEMADDLGLIRPNNPPEKDPMFSYPLPVCAEGFYVIQALDTAGSFHQRHVLYWEKNHHIHMDVHDVTPRRSRRKW